MKLLNATLENRAHLNLTEAEIKTLIDSYWQNFKETCAVEHDENTNKTVYGAIKMIFDHKSTDEWIELLNQTEKVWKGVYNTLLLLLLLSHMHENGLFGLFSNIIPFNFLRCNQ